MTDKKTEKRLVKQANNIEVWEDVINIKDLLLSLFICTATTMGGYLIAPDEPQKPLLYGLVGVIVGFIISSIIIKPKRTLRFEDEEK
ncbi:hypothetical protein [Oceanobacillus massiliensis]|uniref:hypothetical protein n=1 Tax=Oceanobacillus massiliensis TaxID=1465765 RepID=UPI00028845C4|nr:hypothetical protein [Oceanobacillus massiliensis]